MPLFEAPDEPSHVLYVAFVATTGDLPHRSERRDVPGEGMQPPLYYLLEAPIYAAISRYDPGLLSALHDVCLRIYGLVDPRSAPADGPVRVMVRQSRMLAVDPALDYLRALRWGSLLLGLVAVSFSFAALRRASGSTPLAFLGAALLAFVPQFLFVSSYVNNDVACAALGALGFWVFARALERDRVTRGDYAAAGALLALGAATKHSALPTLAVTALAVLALDARPLRERLRDAGLAAGLGLLLAAPVLATNVARFGDPFGVSAVLASTAFAAGSRRRRRAAPLSARRVPAADLHQLLGDLRLDEPVRAGLAVPRLSLLLPRARRRRPAAGPAGGWPPACAAPLPAGERPLDPGGPCLAQLPRAGRAGPSPVRRGAADRGAAGARLREPARSRALAPGWRTAGAIASNGMAGAALYCLALIRISY